MRGMLIDTLILLLLCHYGKTELAYTCNKTVFLHCPLLQHLAVVNVRSSSRMASTLLEQCNTLQECHVANSDKECINVTYWCNTDRDYMEVDSTLRLNGTHLFPNLVSKDYAKGKYQEATDLKCNITLLNSENPDTKNLKIKIYELAPFINSTDYCLSVKDSEMKPFCSGSGKFNTIYGPIPGTNNWQFSLTLSQDAYYVPRVRFWIDIKVTPEEQYLYDMKCSSQAPDHYGKTEVANTCNKTVSLSCPNHIAIIDVSPSSSIASTLLEQCNTCHECHVKNSDKECININYWCSAKDKYKEVESTFGVNKTEKLPNLVSKGYTKGMHQEAKNLRCNITVSNSENNATKKMMIRVYELAPFINSTDYCLSVKNYDIPPICSGSGQFFKTYGPIPGTNNWQFSLALSQDATNVPLVRFWIDVKMVSDEECWYDLQCSSHEPGSDKLAAEVKLSWKAFIIGTTTFCGLSAMLAAVVFMVIFKKKRSSYALQPVPLAFGSVISINHEDADDFPPLPAPWQLDMPFLSDPMMPKNFMTSTLSMGEEYFEPGSTTDNHASFY